MGAWGTGYFENDDAAEFVAELEEEGLDAVESALLVDDDYVEAADAARAIAASVVILAMAGTTFKDLPEEVEAWLEENAEKPKPWLLERAQVALKAVHEDSELRDHYADRDDFDRWDKRMAKLRERIDARAG